MSTKAEKDENQEECVLCLTEIGRWNGIPRSAGAISMSFGYGSRHDGDRLGALICDTCAAKLVQRSRGCWRLSCCVGDGSHWGKQVKEVERPDSETLRQLGPLIAWAREQERPSEMLHLRVDQFLELADRAFLGLVGAPEEDV